MMQYCPRVLSIILLGENSDNPSGGTSSSVSASSSSTSANGYISSNEVVDSDTQDVDILIDNSFETALNVFFNKHFSNNYIFQYVDEELIHLVLNFYFHEAIV